MTEEYLLQTMERAIREAFRLGQQAASDRGRRGQLEQLAVTYAQDLVLPVARVWGEELVEQAHMRAVGERDG